MSLLATTSVVAVSSYALLSAIYRSMQTLNALRTQVPSPTDYASEAGPLPSVDVIVPCFNEDPRTLSACLESIASQDYEGQVRVYVVDDGSDNRRYLWPVQDAYADDPRFNFMWLGKNVGKRKAQIAALRRSSGDLVLNVDSDTTIAIDVVTKLVRKMQDPAVGAVMGQLTASNRSGSWLTRLIDMEYWLACNEERLAEARFGAVLCCCGPCAMYRRTALDLVLHEYETQYFRGKPSDFGEDRHLTILMLAAGFRTEYVPDAIAATVVPDRLVPYLRQQLRWARSTFRDTALALPLLPRLDFYITLDIVGQNLLPLLLGVSILTALAQIAVTSELPWPTILVIACMTMVRCSLAAFRARQLRFLAFALHKPISMFLLLPVKAYALCTLSNSDWLSRKSANMPDSGEGQASTLRQSARLDAAGHSGIAPSMGEAATRAHAFDVDGT